MSVSFKKTIQVSRILRDIDKMLRLKKIKYVHVSRADYRLLLAALELPLWDKRCKQTAVNRFRQEIPYSGISIRPIEN